MKLTLLALQFIIVDVGKVEGDQFQNESVLILEFGTYIVKISSQFVEPIRIAWCLLCIYSFL